MTTDNQHADTVPPHLGQQLRLKRESLGLTIKDISAQLRLNEKVIDGLESNQGLSHFPLIFVRGYLRAYGKLLQMPLDEIQAALEQMQSPSPVPIPITPKRQGLPHVAIRSHHVTRFGTSLIVLTVFTLFGIWWHTHTTTPTLALNKEIPPVITEGAPSQTTAVTVATTQQDETDKPAKTEAVHDIADAHNPPNTAAPHITPSPTRHPADDSEEDEDETA
jgi:cytoskeleton protein RodZ